MGENLPRPVAAAQCPTKLIDLSKSTIEDGDRGAILNNLGIVDVESKYLKNLDRSITFESDKPLAERIAVVMKLKEAKNLADDSRINDSRKYMIGKPSPEFGEKSLAEMSQIEEIERLKVKVASADQKYNLSF